LTISLNGQKLAVLLDGVKKIQGGGIFGVGNDNYKLFKDVYVGNTVYVFGYPSSITRTNPWLDIGIPLLRKGIIAGVNKTIKSIILDCPVFGGNSGGLVLEVERYSTGFSSRAIGIVTDYVPYQKESHENSGYSVVVPMDFVEELISLY